MKKTIGLGIICKDEVGEIDTILSRYSQFFDIVHITITHPSKRKEIEKVCRNHGAEFSYFDWIDDFAAARNFNKSQLKTDYIFRMDTDDSIENPHGIQEMFEDAAANDINIVYCYYVYSKGEGGVCNAAHYRDTMYKNNDNIFWNKKIHENLLVRSNANHRVKINTTVKLIHEIDDDHALQSALRNIKYLMKEYHADKEKTDPRTLAYLGRMLLGIGDFEKAIFFLKKHIESSGWDEDRYLSWCGLAEILKQRGEYDHAIGAAFEAMQERPDFPDAYLKLHDIYFDMKEWGKSIHWGKIGLGLPMPKTFMILDPSSYSWRPTLSMSFAYFQTGDFETAIKLLNVAKREVPNLDWIKQNEYLYTTAIENKRFVDHFMWLYKFAEAKENPKILSLFDLIPDDLKECDKLFALKNKHRALRDYGDNSIVMFCGSSPEPWSPKSVNDGIGGSEEAVINISNSLTKLGYKVTVFSNCIGNEGDYDGVEYKHYTDFNPKDNHNIVVSWRMNIFQFNVNAKKKIVWLHDLPHNIDLTPDAVKTFDKIVVLSNYHKTFVEGKVPEDKIFVSTNGVNEADFNDLISAKKPHRIIYASSYNRGLYTILKQWGDIRKAIPDAELHIYYGWQVFDEFVKSGWIKEDGWKAKMVELMKQDGVKEHGRIGHKELLKEYCKAAIFAYPCNYAGEINCIAFTKAIACGCYPVTNDYAVMGERNKFGLVAKDEAAFKEYLIDALKKSHNDPIDLEYVRENSWDTVAADWKARLL